jgi:hypothetical protein
MNGIEFWRQNSWQTSPRLDGSKQTLTSLLI